MVINNKDTKIIPIIQFYFFFLIQNSGCQVIDGEELVAVFALKKSHIELDHNDIQDVSGIIGDDEDERDLIREKYPAIELSFLAVAQQRRCTGIGRLIIKTIIGRYEEFGFSDCLFLYVDALYFHNGYSSVEFYQKCHFHNSWQNIKIDTYRMFRGIDLELVES